MGVHKSKIQMLFVGVNVIRQGFGKQFVIHAINKLSVKYVDVNEDNYGAVHSYQKMGFKTFKRSEVDSNGDPYPILKMIFK